VINGLDIEALAREPRESAEALASRLTELRSQGATILVCIKYVMLNQGCSLAEAQDIVVNSPTWADRKAEFLRHQQEMFEEFLDYNKDNIESIQQTFASDGAETFIVRMKPPAEQG
jgi:hypothetical protein